MTGFTSLTNVATLSAMWVLEAKLFEQFSRSIFPSVSLHRLSLFFSASQYCVATHLSVFYSLRWQTWQIWLRGQSNRPNAAYKSRCRSVHNQNSPGSNLCTTTLEQGVYFPDHADLCNLSFASYTTTSFGWLHHPDDSFWYCATHLAALSATSSTRFVSPSACSKSCHF